MCVCVCSCCPPSGEGATLSRGDLFISDAVDELATFSLSNITCFAFVASIIHHSATLAPSCVCSEELQQSGYNKNVPSGVIMGFSQIVEPKLMQRSFRCGLKLNEVDCII